ncbi:MAG: hypothetical protein HKN19_10730 [Halioglobus sp.]|nr:hypothetical protein [Halioglobus sp.]
MMPAASLLGGLLFFLACHIPAALSAADSADEGGVIVTGSFSILHAAKGELSPEAAWQRRAEFQPLNPPRNVNAPGKEAWLWATLDPGRGTVLEIPGQLFNYVDVWFRMPDGEVIHDYSGVHYPYVERSIKHTNVAFPLPASPSGKIDTLIRMRNDTSHSMHFAAIIWTEEAWHNRLLGLRLWYGFILGGMAVLLVYNGFLAFALRDVSYLFYGGYLTALAVSVLLCSGLAEEFFWPEGKPTPMILAVSGIGSLFVVAFANSFLRVKERYPRTARYSLLMGTTAAVLGVATLYNFTVPGIPSDVTATFFHSLVVSSSLYFIAISVRCYLAGMQQARFLIVSMFALMSCMLVYWSYTYAVTPFNLYSGHFLEIGGLAEGILLSLALSDRINILTAERRAAQQQSLEYQRFFTRGLINAQEQEKKALSEKMHDSVGHAMLVLINNLKRIAEKFTDQSPEIREKIEEQIEYSSVLMDEIRDISHDLHPHMLTRLGLAAALESTIERAAQSKDLTTDIDIEAMEGDLPDEVEIALYRIVQECLNNVLKYADATTIRFRLEQGPDTLTAILEDDGKGFDPATIDGDGLGFSEIVGRTSLLGGKFDVASKPGQGTRVSIYLPIEAT